jgi:hypothetical protein
MLTLTRAFGVPATIRPVLVEVSTPSCSEDGV